MIPIWAAKYIGIQFKDGGRTINGGVDCWGLILNIYLNEFGRYLPSYSGNYADTKDFESLNELITEESKLWKKISKGNEEIGDVIVMNIRGNPCHVGVVVEKGKLMLHIEQGINSAIERYDTSRWSKRVSGFYRYAN